MPQRVTLSTCAAPLLLFVLAAGGCSDREVYPVEGRLVYPDGQAASDLKGYVVTFESEAQQVSGFGVVQEDGRFEVGTYEEDDGAVPGKHRIAITPPMNDSDAPPPTWLIDQKYGDFSTSGLEAEIGPDQTEVAFTVEPATT